MTSEGSSAHGDAESDDGVGLAVVEQRERYGSGGVRGLAVLAMVLVVFGVLYAIQDVFGTGDFEHLTVFLFPGYTMCVVTPPLACAGVLAYRSLKKYPRMLAGAQGFHYVVIGWAVIAVFNSTLMGVIVILNAMYS
jgi:hypothetical protein